MIMAKKMYLEKILDKKDCWGFVVHTKGNHYFWQNDNDMGLIFDTDWEDIEYKETILRKIEVIKGKYIYVLRNNYNYPDGEDCATLTTIKALIKDAHGSLCDYYKCPMTKHEQMLVKRYYDYESLKYRSTSKLPF